jgi:histidyl-tRNA synthetase
MTISTKPYIGSRDFFPEDMRFRRWMFETQERVCRSYGYGEYSAPILEPLELYSAKSSEEIVSEQLYRFTDRGDREVAIRPEMTPTLARMIASRLNELVLPLRLYSIANFMRYERPGKGRLREFFQLNVDLIGAPSYTADAEVIMIAADILLAYGASLKDFTIRYSDRRLLDSYLKGIAPDRLRLIGRVLDKREKISAHEFESGLNELCDADEKRRILDFVGMSSSDLGALAWKGEIDDQPVSHLLSVESTLKGCGLGEALRFDPGIMRGFDYYTGLIFEINDSHPENRRALFGGGRYDRLLGLYGKRDVPAVGFGMGDVTLENFIRMHGLESAHIAQDEGVFITLFSEDLYTHSLKLAEGLRKRGVTAEISLEPSKKFGRQFELAQKKRRRYAIILGEDEIRNGICRLKDLQSGEQYDFTEEGLYRFFDERKI